MRLFAAATAAWLILGAWADVSPPPPPGSACLESADQYRPKGDQVSPTVVDRRSLGITRLPRQWVRQVLNNIVERAGQADDLPCISIFCACVPPGKKAAYGGYTKTQCPLQHGASWDACNVYEDGWTCVFSCGKESLAKSHFTDEKCNAEFPGTTALCTSFDGVTQTPI